MGCYTSLSPPKKRSTSTTEKKKWFYFSFINKDIPPPPIEENEGYDETYNEQEDLVPPIPPLAADLSSLPVPLGGDFPDGDLMGIPPPPSDFPPPPPMEDGEYPDFADDLPPPVIDER